MFLRKQFTTKLLYLRTYFAQLALGQKLREVLIAALADLLPQFFRGKLFPKMPKGFLPGCNV